MLHFSLKSTPTLLYKITYMYLYNVFIHEDSIHLLPWLLLNSTLTGSSIPCGITNFDRLVEAQNKFHTQLHTKSEQDEGKFYFYSSQEEFFLVAGKELTKFSSTPAATSSAVESDEGRKNTFVRWRKKKRQESRRMRVSRVLCIWLANVQRLTLAYWISSFILVGEEEPFFSLIFQPIQFM